jgi:hypothetical protein
MNTYDDREGLLNYLVTDVEGLVRRASLATSATSAALLGEAQELLALHAGILRRREAAYDASQQLDLPFERKAA